MPRAPRQAGTHRRRDAVARVLRRLRGPVLDPSVQRDDWLHCRRCGSSAVCPIDWAPDGEEAWCIDVRCGECGAWAELGLSNGQAARFDVLLDAQTAQIARAAEELERERVEREVETLIVAFRRDLIGPDDFMAPRLRHRVI